MSTIDHANIAHAAVLQYMRSLELELKRIPGIAPEDALAETRDQILKQLNSLGASPFSGSEAQWLDRLAEVFGTPAETAKLYVPSETMRERRGGNAPGWRICCTVCGRSAPATLVGIVRLHAVSVHKYVLGYCSKCRRLRWTRLLRDLDQSNLTDALGIEGDPVELRRSMHHPHAVFWSLMLGIPLLVGMILALVWWLKNAPKH